MSNANVSQEAIDRLVSQADAVGRLAQDTGGFAAVLAAFESADANAVHWVLDRLELRPYCELICEWVRIKLCALRCAEICGPPREKAKIPNLQQFAQAVVKLSSEEKLLRRVVDAVSCGDPSAYQSALEELKLVDFCDLICQWVCSIGYRRVCEVVCIPRPLPFPDPVSEIRAAGKFLEGVLANEKVLDSIAKASLTLKCEILQEAIVKAGFLSGCEYICSLICTHRCVQVCRELCEVFPLIAVPRALAIEEAQSFALASRSLAGHSRALYDLVNAVQNRDLAAYRDIIAGFGLGPYCWQVCRWVCSVICFEYCRCVCPPPGLHPWFTKVGYFGIYADIDSTSGKTNKSLPFVTLGAGGGPNFAFFGPLELRGFCPINSPTVPGIRMKYRFLFDAGSGPLPITGTLVSPVDAGTRLVSWPINAGGNASAVFSQQFQDVIIQAAPTPPDPTPPAPGSPWVGPAPHYISPDANGWVEVDPNAIGGGFQTLLGFDTTDPSVAPGGLPNPGVPAGIAVPPGNQRAGKDLSIIFEATRVNTFPPGTTADFSNSLPKIHINNWSEVNELGLVEFGTGGCCTPINASLSVQFTVDHEEMDSGAWSLGISSCSPSAPGDITPTVSGPGVTVSARGGSGTIVENTSSWSPCSYTVTLTTRPGLTTGLVDRSASPNSLTFCICGH
jgi:hypothetical protein